MERWKRNIPSLIFLSAVACGAYLLWLYRTSGGSMVVSYEMPDWTFPFLAGAIVFAIAFGGGFVGLALTNPDLSEEKAGVLQLFLVSLLLGVVSTVTAFWMTGFLSLPLTLVLLAAALTSIVLVVRVKREKLTPSVPVTDERERLIDLKSQATAGNVLLTVLAVGYLISRFDNNLRLSPRTLLFALLGLYLTTWLIARFHYQRVM